MEEEEKMLTFPEKALGLLNKSLFFVKTKTYLYIYIYFFLYYTVDRAPPSKLTTFVTNYNYIYI